MDRFSSLGKAVRRFAPALLGPAVCLTLAATFVGVLEQRRLAPDLATLNAQLTGLEQDYQRLQQRAPIAPIHQQMKRLRQLAQTLPGLPPLQAVRSTGESAEPVRELTGGFAGAVWKVALKGHFTSVIALCRMAQPVMPLIVDSIQVRGRTAHVVLFLLGTDAHPKEAA